MQKTMIAHALAAFALLFSASVGAQVMQPGPASSDVTLKDAAQAAVLKSPEVLARWHAYREAGEEVGVARGGFYPKIDLSAGSGRRKTVQDRVGEDSSYNGNETTLALRQMLFDGFATSSEVKRLGKAKLVRYFELLDASENVALEAARAYLDVLRYRQHVSLAEDNYLQHQTAYEQLKRRADSGVGKRVDVDQAASRLALADVNLTTAYSNLHDVSARYLRIVGENPNREMAVPARPGQGFPDKVDVALTTALKQNPALRASIENIEVSQYDLEARRAAFMPKLDIVARRDDYSNYEDDGSRDDSRVELRLNYNLFNGGSDMARSRQYRERKNVALDQREKACRDVRQTLSIAFNDALRLNDQLAQLALQVGLVEKTRTAYRDQFNIGQRTLLDLLNTQNEYFDARLSQVDADANLSLAYLRSYAGMGRLLETLGLKHVDMDDVPSAQDFASVDATQLCPPFVPVETTLDREGVVRKAKTLAENGPGFAGTRPHSAGSVQAPSVARADTPARTSPAGSAESDVARRVDAWAEAWGAADVKRYLGFYAPAFTPEKGMSRDAWENQRQQRISQAQGLHVEIRNLVVKPSGPDTVLAEFRQIYRSDTFSDATDKVLKFRKVNGQWLIVRESVRAAASETL